jgi:DNA-binding IclR family transcriptional regulator
MSNSLGALALRGLVWLAPDRRVPTDRNEVRIFECRAQPGMRAALRRSVAGLQTRRRHSFMWPERGGEIEASVGRAKRVARAGAPSETTASDGRAFGPRSVLRVMDILEAIANDPEGVTLARISAQLELPKTSVFSLLRALEGGDYVENSNGRYALGPEALRLGATLNQSRSFPKCMRPILEWLAKDTEETVLLGVLTEEGDEVSYLDIIESEKPLRFSVRPGNRRPLYCSAAGKVMLAFLPAAIQEQYLARTTFVRFTSATPSKSDMRGLLPLIRDRSVDFDVDSMIDGATGIASPGFDAAGRVACSVTIAGPTTRMRKIRKRVEQLAVKAGEQMSRILGYRGAYPPS